MTMYTNSEYSHFDEEYAELRLWEYIDGRSEEASVIENLIRERSEWKVKYAELLNVHHLIAITELEEPSLRFTKNVMDEIARCQIAPATKKYINTKIIWSLAVFFIAIIVGFLFYGISQIDWSAAGSNAGGSGFNLGAVDYSRMFGNSIVNGFMMLNILLGLLLLDRFLSMKRTAYREGHFRV